MRRLLGLSVCVLALSLLGGAAAAPIDWKALPYFDYANQRLRLSTDGDWKGAHVVDAGTLNLQADTSWPKLKRQWIWAPTCGANAQRVVFSESFLVPGVPLDGSLTLMYGPGNQLLGNRPYQSAVFQINGIEVGRLGDLARFPRKLAPLVTVTLTERMLKAFRYGANTATIRVERAALKKGDTCTHPGATSGGDTRYIAVAADLSLNFGSDLRALPPKVKKQVRRGVTNGQSVAAMGTVRFTNDGPSTSLGGTLIVTASTQSGTLLLTNLINFHEPLDKADCTIETDRLTCTYDELKVGKQLVIDVAAGTKVNTGYFRSGAGKLDFRWVITGRSRDPGKTYNNEESATVVMCVAGATDPACA
jgi:hypothetical protein